MTWRAFPRVAVLLLPLLLGSYAPTANVGYLGTMQATSDGRPTLPCTIGGTKSTCVIDTGSAVALTLPQGMAVHGYVEPFAATVAGVTGQQRATVRVVMLAMAGQRASVLAVSPQGYSGLPLVGVPGIRALRALVVVDGGKGEAWFVVVK